MKEYTLDETTFTQKDFRRAGNRKQFYIEYGKVVSGAFKDGNTNVYGYVAEQCIDEQDTPHFDTFLAPFIEGDFNKIKELQATDAGMDKLIDLSVVVLTDFLLLKTVGVVK